MVDMIEIFIPTTEPRIRKFAINPRLHQLNGKVLGFLWNEKPNGDVLLHRLQMHLSRKYKLAGTVWEQIGGLHVDVDTAPEIKKIADAADTVIIAVCD
jgi:hypothetical protein